MIYVRRGTSCEIANEEELVRMIERRINYKYPNSGSPLELSEHLSQLKDLYDGPLKSIELFSPNCSCKNSLNLSNVGSWSNA